jgi:hypothetical protein
MIAFIDQTIPAVNIPSKKILGNQCVSKILEDKPPRHIDIKNPTQVDVHNVQEIKSPKKFECFLMNIRVFSKMVPQTIIDVNP